MASSQKNSQSRAFHRCASGRGFTPWSTLNETSPLSALPNVVVSQWHPEETHPTLPHVKTGSTPCPVRMELFGSGCSGGGKTKPSTRPPIQRSTATPTGPKRAERNWP